MNATADELALLATVCAYPGDDTPRGLYTDYLEGDRVPPDLERAEFIRVQVELARRGDKTIRTGLPGASVKRVCSCGPYPCRGCNELRRREGELWAVVCGSLRKPISELLGERGSLYYDDPPSREVTWDWVGLVRRGFVGSLTLPWAAWAGGRCGLCADTFAVGDGPSHTIHYTNCPACSGSGRTPGVAEALYWRMQPCPRCLGMGSVFHDEMPTMVKCPRCEGSGRVPPTMECPECEDESGYRIYCTQCEGSGRAGRVLRPCPPTAQPIERVAFTTAPDVDEAELSRRWPGIEFEFPTVVVD